MPRLIGPADHKVQRVLPLPDLQKIGPAAYQRGDIPSSRLRHDLTDGFSIGQKRVQIAVQKGIDAELPPPGGHRVEKAAQLRIRGSVGAVGVHAAAHAHQLVDGRVHQGHRLPHRPVEAVLGALQRHIVPQHTEGVLCPAAQLDRCRGRLLFKPFQTHSLLLFKQPAPPTWPQSRCRTGPQDPWQNNAGRP